MSYLKKRKNIFVFFIMICLLFLFVGKNVAMAIMVPDTNREKMLSMVSEFVEEVDPSEYKTIDATMFEEMLNADLTASELNGYTFLFDNTTQSMKAVIPKSENRSVLFQSIDSADKAITIAKQLVEEFNPEFLQTQYEVKCSPASDLSQYTIEFWEKLDNDYYTNNRIGIILTAGGQLDSYIATNSAASKQNAISTSEQINESEAINLAYSYLQNTVSDLQAQENIAANNKFYVPKDGVDSIVTDSGKKANEVISGFDSYEIYLDSKTDHVITTHRVLCNNQTEWVIGIENVRTNRAWTISFIVTIDAQSGKLLCIDHTR